MHADPAVHARRWKHPALRGAAARPCRRTGLSRRWALAPLAFAALLLAHPMGETFYAAAKGHNTAWLTVHVGAAVLFPLMAAVVWRLLRGVDSRAAGAARAALAIFAVTYTAWEVMTGIATGVLAGAGDVQGVERITTHWISGELGVFNSVGSLAWTVAIAAAVIALRAAGARRGVLFGLGAAAAMVMHIPPIGPLALLGLATAVVLAGQIAAVDDQLGAGDEARVLARQVGDRP